MFLADAASPNLINLNYGLMVWTLVCFVVVLVRAQEVRLRPASRRCSSSAAS